MEYFEGKVFLITGASSGIGKAVSIAISKKGGRVVLIGRDAERLQETLDEMDNREEHIIISYDLTDLENYRVIFDQLKAKNIILDGMVHCAGITSVLPLRIMNMDNSMELFKIHYFAFVELVKYYAKKGVSNGGSIVGISAINVHTPQKCMTAYAAAKAAMESACRTLALELVEKNIRINSVVVGGVNTKMSNQTSSVIQSIGSSYENPVQRQLLEVAGPEKIVGPILFLLGPDSSYITGRELFADGGLL